MRKVKMKRLELNRGAYAYVLTEMDALPSHVEKAYKSISKNTEIYSIKELCLTDKNTLAKLPDVSKDIVKAIEVYLKKHGLHLGMTMDELYDYMDADYMEKRQEMELLKVDIPSSHEPKSIVLPDINDNEATEENSKEKKNDKSDADMLLIVSSFIGALAAILSLRIIDITVDALIRLF